MAGIDGIVSITRRTAPGVDCCSSLSVLSRMEGGGPFDAVLRLFFKCGEAGVKWIPQVGMSDLLG